MLTFYTLLCFQSTVLAGTGRAATEHPKSDCSAML